MKRLSAGSAAFAAAGGFVLLYAAVLSCFIRLPSGLLLTALLGVALLLTGVFYTRLKKRKWPLGLLCAAFALLLAAISKQKTALCAVFLFPLFMASWLPLNLVSLLFRTRVWKEIEHGKTVHPALPAASLRRVRSGISD